MYQKEQFVILLFLSVIAFVDHISRRIPNIICFLFLAGKAAFLAADLCYTRISSADILRLLAGWAAFSAILMLIWGFFRGGIGAGDMKELSVLYLYVGLDRILWIAWLTGAAVCVVYAGRREKGKEGGIPLGPYILLAYIITEWFHF